jgi:DNA-binding transcriptional regulator YbjK
MPALNPQRRDALTDAAISVLARSGTHGLSHRAVDERAGVPAGTTSNYFRSREALLAATAERIMHLHFSWLDEIRAQHGEELDRAQVIDVLVNVVDEAIERHSDRYLAMFHLSLESTYRHELAESLGRVVGLAHQLIHAAHTAKGTTPSPDDVALLHSSYIGLLFSGLVLPEVIGDRRPGDVARAMLTKVLPVDEPAG